MEKMWRFIFNTGGVYIEPLDFEALRKRVQISISAFSRILPNSDNRRKYCQLLTYSGSSSCIWLWVSSVTMKYTSEMINFRKCELSLSFTLKCHAHSLLMIDFYLFSITSIFVVPYPLNRAAI